MTGRAVSTGAAGALLLVTFLGGCIDSLGERTCNRFLQCGAITEDQVDECFRSYRDQRMELPDREKSTLAAAPANCLIIKIDPDTMEGCQDTLACFERRGAPVSRFVAPDEGMAGAGGSGGSTGGTGGMTTGGAAGMGAVAGMSGAGGTSGGAGTSGAAGMSGAAGVGGAAGASGGAGAAGMSGAAGASGAAGSN